MRFRCDIVSVNAPIVRVLKETLALVRPANPEVSKDNVCAVEAPVACEIYSGLVTVEIISGLLRVERSVLLLLRSMTVLQRGSRLVEKDYGGCLGCSLSSLEADMRKLQVADFL